MDSLYDTLQAEFCPPLDSPLLAALIQDLNPSLPLSDQLETLRTTLKELASQATKQFADDLDSANLSITTDESNSSPDFCADTVFESSNNSDSSAISYQSFDSPLGFLQAALPHIPQSRLRRALSESGARDDGDIDMEAIVETLLTNEYVRELEERGLSALDDNEPEDDPWKPVESKKKPTPAKKKNVRGKTITLVDIRQRQHIKSPLPTAPRVPDQWAQLSSLSDHLATLLPPRPASFFQSYFHSPNYPSPANALRAALSSIGCNLTNPPSNTTLFNILDVLRESPTHASLNPEQRSTLYADVQLALRATQDRGDDAIDIVWLLLELDLDLESGSLAMGVYHVPKSPLSPSRSSAWVSPSPVSSQSSTSRDRSGSTSAAVRQLPSGPPPVQPPPTSRRKSVSAFPESLSTSDQSRQFEWQTVPQKPPKGPHPLALHIPAYDPANQSRRSAAVGKLRGTGNGIGKGGKGDVGELSRPDIQHRISASMRKRNELLREASKAWARGNTRTRGGEVALYFAERAREFQELARREALHEARLMVESKRSAAADRHTIDLHGTSIAEAVVLAKEILEQDGCSAASPLKIITGRGKHSVNGVGVLKPAVRNALVRDGWNVGVWDGGLVVRGRTATS